jgi:hypothetical protein
MSYPKTPADSLLRVTRESRQRLKVLAAERDTTIGDIVSLLLARYENDLKCVDRVDSGTKSR